MSEEPNRLAGNTVVPLERRQEILVQSCSCCRILIAPVSRRKTLPATLVGRRRALSSFSGKAEILQELIGFAMILRAYVR